MEELLLVTGNQNKADYLSKYLGFPVLHEKIDLDEIQSMDLKEIVKYKLKEAYDKVNKPVVVEDVALGFDALGGLPGPFVKFFVENMSFENICSMIPKNNRNAIAKCIFGYYDGKNMEFFEGKLEGKIAVKPSGDNGYGWDKIFIPKGYDITRASLNEQEDKETYLKLKPFSELKRYLESLN